MSECNHSCIKNFLGPSLVSVFIHCVESGIIIGQAITFWSYVDSNTARTRVENSLGWRQRQGMPDKLIKAVAVYVLLMSIVQTTLSVVDAWKSVVINFGNVYGAIEMHWLTKVQQLNNTLLSAPAQGFLIWRCWMVSNRNNYLLTGLITLIIASAVMSVIVTVNIFNAHIELTLSTEILATDFAHYLYPYLVSSLLLSAVLDIVVTGILFSYLLRSWRVVVTRRFRKTLQLLILVIWEAALPPCICAIATLILCSRFVKESFWFLLFEETLGQLYVISFFVTVNGFLSIRHAMDSGIMAATALGTSWEVAGNNPQNNDLEHARAYRSTEGTFGINVTVNVQTTHDPENTTGLSLAQKLLRRTHRTSRQRHVVDIPLSLHSPDSDQKCSGADAAPNTDEGSICEPK